MADEVRVSYEQVDQDGADGWIDTSSCGLWGL
jgi:hypothetical protein